MFQAGLSIFSVGSLLCGLAPSLGLLIAFRTLQAIGGSTLNPVAMSIILGPVVGGAHVDSVGRRAVFFVNVPIGLWTTLLTTRFVPEPRAERARRLDPVGKCW